MEACSDDVCHGGTDEDLAGRCADDFFAQFNSPSYATILLRFPPVEPRSPNMRARVEGTSHCSNCHSLNRLMGKAWDATYL
ncbi:unnamed protein product [Protopolystoma xenopodis]|uniref:Uncharacterized protein n=1 Tax=Protopolystoma xenopodis TaxID=117903 RepID=A0A3S5CQY6_9PLAT|nr:unnamed protein product [Protopolystoma xenopodis]